jgi:hypothetical protein
VSLPAVVPIATRPVRRGLVPGDRVAWVDHNGETQVGTVADDDGPMGGLAIGPPGGPLQHLVAVVRDDPTHVPAEALRLI